MAALTITFTYGTTTTLDTPDYPEEWQADLDQWRSTSIGGTVWTATRQVVTQRTPVLHWDMLPESQYNNLFTFIYTTVSGSENVFTFVDWDTTTWNATYLGGLEKAKQSDLDCWRVDLQLKVSTP